MDFLTILFGYRLKQLKIKKKMSLLVQEIKYLWLIPTYELQ